VRSLIREAIQHQEAARAKLTKMCSPCESAESLPSLGLHSRRHDRSVKPCRPMLQHWSWPNRSSPCRRRRTTVHVAVHDWHRVPFPGRSGSGEVRDIERALALCRRPRARTCRPWVRYTQGFVEIQKEDWDKALEILLPLATMISRSRSAGLRGGQRRNGLRA